jgi:hypothetical protein
MLSLFCGQISTIKHDSRSRERIRSNLKDWLSQPEYSGDFALDLPCVAVFNEPSQVSRVTFGFISTYLILREVELKYVWVELSVSINTNRLDLLTQQSLILFTSSLHNLVHEVPKTPATVISEHQPSTNIKSRTRVPAPFLRINGPDQDTLPVEEGVVAFERPSPPVCDFCQKIVTT